MVPLWQGLVVGEIPCLGNATPITPGYPVDLTSSRHQAESRESLYLPLVNLPFVLSSICSHHTDLTSRKHPTESRESLDLLRDL